MQNTKYWEFSSHISQSVEYFAMQQGGIPLVGVGTQKNRCRADFQVSGTMPQFGINSGDGENRRGIEFIVPKHLFVLLRIVSGNHS